MIMSPSEPKWGGAGIHLRTMRDRRRLQLDGSLSDSLHETSRGTSLKQQDMCLRQEHVEDMVCMLEDLQRSLDESGYGTHFLLCLLCAGAGAVPPGPRQRLCLVLLDKAHGQAGITHNVSSMTETCMTSCQLHVSKPSLGPAPTICRSMLEPLTTPARGFKKYITYAAESRCSRHR